MELDDEDETTEDWYQGILNSLKLHSHSLKELLLEPWDYELTESSDSGFDRFDFRLFKALEVLEWSPTGEWQYPTICDVMPPTLQELILTMTPDYTPGSQGFENVFTSGLPSHSNEDNAKVTFGLKSFNLTYNKMSHDRALPMDFWHIQNAFRKAGSEFQYSVSMLIDDNMDPSVSTDAEVMDVLGLSKEWLDSNEAREILLGDKVNYDAKENKWEIIEQTKAMVEKERASTPQRDTDEETPDDQEYGDYDSNDPLSDYDYW
ncbi:hypothetical protein E8E13_010560 [Curvularia kusanoi]|uniref:Uncharacterized protein n=1 Tax=Curvularia kusanoi TaxID=90978 RepID=A0A9P4TLK2_CURKU|nr:hypothetical protein E8E13_010560 [Curvularia kusanoi]